LRKQADLLMTRGQNELRAGKKEGPDTLKEAREAFKKMPAASVFAESARDRAENIRRILLEYFKREGEVRVAERPPRWKEAMDLFEEAIRFTSSLDEKRPITERIGYCEINRHDVETLTEVVKIVQSKDEQNFGRCRELLDSIGDKSYYNRAAQAYRSWFKADGLARGAITAYNQGQLDNAVRLMTDAIKLPELEPVVVQSGRGQIERWRKVDEALKKGFDAQQKGDLTAAKELFRSVLDLEPVKDNLFRQRAEKELSILENREQEDLDTALKQGIDLLEAGKCDEAYEKFCFVLERAQNPGPPRTLIEEAVARVNTEKGLYKEANGIAKSANKNRYHRAHEILQLLGRFLPDKNADRQAAIDLLPRVK
ncbi:MAG: hypothetical protein ACAI25_01175, partial [Planctomycetota bacterium]